MNEGILESRVRLIDQGGKNLGIVAIEAARRIAGESDMDLVELVPDAKPPVCRIMDYGKYRFLQAKKAQLARKRNRCIQVKEVKFRPATDQADYQTKLRNLRRFLEAGDKAKVTIRFRGREMAHQDQGRIMLDRVKQDLEAEATIEQEPKTEGRQMTMVFAPRKKPNGNGRDKDQDQDKDQEG